MLNRKALELDLCDLTPTVSLPSCHPAFPRPWGPTRRLSRDAEGMEPARGCQKAATRVGTQCGGAGEHGVIGWQMKPGLEGAVATELAGTPICPALAQRAREEERRRMVLTCAPSLQSHLLSLGEGGWEKLDLSHVLLSPSTPKLCLWGLRCVRGCLGMG